MIPGDHGNGLPIPYGIRRAHASVTEERNAINGASGRGSGSEELLGGPRGVCGAPSASFGLLKWPGKYNVQLGTEF